MFGRYPIFRHCHHIRFFPPDLIDRGYEFRDGTKENILVLSGVEVFDLPLMQILGYASQEKVSVSSQTQEGSALLTLFIRFKPRAFHIKSQRDKYETRQVGSAPLWLMYHFLW